MFEENSLVYSTETSKRKKPQEKPKSIIDSEALRKASEGKQFERDLLGDTKYEKRLEFFGTLNKSIENYEIITTMDALEAVQDIQPKKESAFLKDLKSKILIKFRIKGHLDIKDNDIECFTSVGYSPLDDYNGTDFFIKIKSPNGKERIITLDVTLDDKEEKGAGIADVVRQFSSDMEIDNDNWKDSLKFLSNEVVEKILSNEQLQMEKDENLNRAVSVIPVNILKKIAKTEEEREKYFGPAYIRKYSTN